MMDFTNIPEILDFLVAHLRIPDESMISGRFPHAKPVENKLSPEKRFPETEKNDFGEKFLGEKFRGGNVSGGNGFRSVQISEIDRI